MSRLGLLRPSLGIAGARLQFCAPNRLLLGASRPAAQSSPGFSGLARCINTSRKLLEEAKANTTEILHQSPYPASAALGPGFGAVPHAPVLKKPRLVSTKAVGYWLLAAAASVFGIVILGGLTRLTESGLSITEWRPITGSLPPRTEEDWNREFALYRESPEFQQLNSNISLEEYKFIYFMEWGHRLWGRAIGLFVVLPAIYFVARRRTSPATNRALLGISLLLGFQGFLGWWMVKSGLDQDHLNARDNSQPRVSQYRLAAHLGAAFLVYIAMAFTGLGILRDDRLLNDPQAAMKDITLLRSAAITPFRRYAKGLLALAFLTSMSGAFVAGLDAGLLYNTFPLMGNRLVPSEKELLVPAIAERQGLEPTAWNVFRKNMLENPVTVQLTHRVLAVSTWALTLGLVMYSLRVRAVLPRPVFRASHLTFGFVTLQAALGISTLVYVIPTPLASMHQAGSLLFLTSLVVLLVRLKLPRKQVLRLLELMAQKAAQKAPK